MIDLQHINWWIFIGLFFGYTLNDAVYAWYTMAVVDRKPTKAALLSSVMYFMIALGVLSYVKNIAYIIPVVAGSFVGTYIAVGKILSRKLPLAKRR